jgi:alpha-ketoglutarate-dependent taurine dioxygenase
VKSSVPIPSPPVARSPFSLDDDRAYRHWRETKLERYPSKVEEIIVEINDPRALTAAEAKELVRVCRKTNMVIYASRARACDRGVVHAVSERIGLTQRIRNLLEDDDGITSVCAVAGKAERGYIPYTNKRMSWHTDGYYNDPDRSIRAFVLHCATPAQQGGENAFVDPELLYVHLRDADPAYIRSLMAADVMTIPANSEPGSEVRAACSGPVFSIDLRSGDLHMRYTARTRNIAWKQDSETATAVRKIEELLESASPYLFRHRLCAGQGVLCNNVLHNRTAFVNDADHGVRLLYRARYYDRIPGTGVGDEPH